MRVFQFSYRDIQGQAVFDTDLATYRCTMGAVEFRLDAIDPSSDLYQHIDKSRAVNDDPYRERITFP